MWYVSNETKMWTIVTCYNITIEVTQIKALHWLKYTYIEQLECIGFNKTEINL